MKGFNKDPVVGVSATDGLFPNPLVEAFI